MSFHLCSFAKRSRSQMMLSSLVLRATNLVDHISADLSSAVSNSKLAVEVPGMTLSLFIVECDFVWMSDEFEQIPVRTKVAKSLLK